MLHVRKLSINRGLRISRLTALEVILTGIEIIEDSGLVMALMYYRDYSDSYEFLMVPQENFIHLKNDIYMRLIDPEKKNPRRLEFVVDAPNSTTVLVKKYSLSKHLYPFAKFST